MSNVEDHPQITECASAPTGAQLITYRDVPLGGPRSMTVRRTLPSRERTLIGAWCFIDHYGPDDVADSGGMHVAPHPHIGLQTVSWLFSGEVEHRDSAGNHAFVRPGELNLMTAGRGISHSEISTPNTTTLHGAQLWVALPEHARAGDPTFAHYAPRAVRGPGWTASVFLGTLAGSTSPVATATPLLGAEVVLDPGAEADLAIDEAYEVGVLVDHGSVHANGLTVVGAELGYLPPGSDRLHLRAGDETVRLLILGGPPFGEAIVMWWNFIGRTHEDIEAARTEWQRQIDGVTDSQDVAAGAFGTVVGDHLPPIPAPALPNGVRLKERR